MQESLYQYSRPSIDKFFVGRPISKNRFVVYLKKSPCGLPASKTASSILGIFTPLPRFQYSQRWFSWLHRPFFSIPLDFSAYCWIFFNEAEPNFMVLVLRVRFLWISQWWKARVFFFILRVYISNDRKSLDFSSLENS